MIAYITVSPFYCSIISSVLRNLLKPYKYYREDLANFFKSNILSGSRVLEIGCGEGYLLSDLDISHGVGIDASKEIIKHCKKKLPAFDFYHSRGEDFVIDEEFDYVILSDTLSLVGDVQKIFNRMRSVCTKDTRIIVSTYNYLWRPALILAEFLGLKQKTSRDNWLTLEDLSSLLYVEGFQVVKQDRRLLFPVYIPIISPFINRYIARLPLINHLCLTNTIIARPLLSGSENLSVSIVIPTRNEAGNIEETVRRLPKLGKDTEIIFVEGGSTDGTVKKIKSVMKKCKDLNIKFVQQKGTGKGDAVRCGFSKASGDIYMILDADLSVMPEDLEKFYRVVCENKGEFVFGSRLVYAMEDGAMRVLNVFGNQFFSSVFTWLLNTPIKDTLCGTKIISADNYKRLAGNRSYFGEFDPFGDFDLIFGAAKLNLKFVEIPIKYHARVYGSTNISRFKNGVELLRMVFFCMDKIKFV
jgi:SAM-dependent methyltransferase